MGLAGEKKRMKLSHDPNNTKWTNDSTSFGLKMMTAQGWQPGQYLGAKDAAHAEFHTAANSSHIRVSIKDDNLGLGAKIGTGVGHGECTGLDAFKNLLGRLNGKEESEIEKEQRSRDDLRRAIYSERKWGTQRFISGGFLIGDKIQILIDAEAERIRKLASGGSDDISNDPSSSAESEEEAAPVTKPQKSKKRKAEVLDRAEPEVVAFKVKKSKKERKKQKAVEDSAPSEEEEVSKKPRKCKKDRKLKPETEGSEEELEIKRRKEKKNKKEKKRKGKAGSDAEVWEMEKEKKKREKRARREKKKAAEEGRSEASEPSLSTAKESTPVAAPSRATTMLQGRHAVRSRFIKQKKLASMDPASLAQIFMIKSQ